MAEIYQVAIIGAGPAGLSAAARAAEQKLSHILLEASPQLSNTIFRYQKGKHVMAEPHVLPLRSALPFIAGAREEVLASWEQQTRQLAVNVRDQAEVMNVSGTQGDFTISLKHGEPIHAQHVVLSIGLQGNLRKLGVSGEDLPWVQYQLDDPDEYEAETIIVIGAGDAAIENALALAGHNTVSIVNRKDEFARCKDANRESILKAIESGSIQCYYNATVVQADDSPDEPQPGLLVLETPEGQARIACDRIIARLGAIPPRRFVQACGIEFPNDDPASVPAVSSQYQSNVPGLYIIGALAGYPLIKQCMNQGYEVIEYIQGNPVAPADEDLLKEKFSAMPGFTSVDDTLTMIQQRVPLLAGITRLQLREFLLDSGIHHPEPGSVIFTRDDYTDSFYSILQGNVSIPLGSGPKAPKAKLLQGDFFGEMSLLSGRRRSATVYAGANCLLLETPRRSMVKLISSVAAVKRVIDEAFIRRAIQSKFAPEAPAEILQQVAANAVLKHYQANQVLFAEGDAGDTLELIRRGSVTISRRIDQREIILSYVAAGNYVGEMALLGNTTRSATVTATVPTETIAIDQAAFQLLLDNDAKLRDAMQTEYRQRTLDNVQREQESTGGDVISFLMQQGIGEATDVLLIDESLCVRCDNCETACAETHQGTSRLDREAGPTFAMVHVPTSCRHCEHPHCMQDCPPDAIHRAANGEVFIEDSCIGCGNCVRNCPYDVIHMATPPPKKPGLLNWLLFGAGPGPGDHGLEAKGNNKGVKQAVKCDMCKDLSGGPACVRACPTGAAIRIAPDALAQYINKNVKSTRV